MILSHCSLNSAGIEVSGMTYYTYYTSYCSGDADALLECVPMLSLPGMALLTYSSSRHPVHGFFNLFNDARGQSCRKVGRHNFCRSRFLHIGS